MNHDLTQKELRNVAAQHCRFIPEGTYRLTEFDGWYAVEAMIRECIALDRLTQQALLVCPHCPAQPND